jgi:N-acetylmuramoyl-L-alanine amidase
MKWVLISFFLIPTMFLKAEPSYLETQARPGDGVYSLLRLYHINTPCNVSYFYHINKLKRKQGLHATRTYKLPIFIYKYNKTSIRTTLGITDLPLAERIQAYNDYMLKAGLKAGDYRKDLELWVPSHFMKCPEEKLELSEEALKVMELSGGEVTSKVSKKAGLRGTYDIFGKKEAEVYLKGTELAGSVYYIVSGHGGPDPGAVGRYWRKDLCEDEYAYDVALRLAKGLLERGATAYVIVRDPDDGIRSGEILPCDKDEVIWGDEKIPYNQKVRLDQRAQLVNKLYLKNKRQGVTFQRMIVIHVDSDAKNERVDMFFYHRMADKTSQAFASTLRETIKQKYDIYQKGRGYEGSVSVRDLWMLRETLPPTAFIELGNIRNPQDQTRLVRETNRQLVAEWLLDGVLRDRKKGE